jgi:hypothetical protein
VRHCNFVISQVIETGITIHNPKILGICKSNRGITISKVGITISKWAFVYQRTRDSNNGWITSRHFATASTVAIMHAIFLGMKITAKSVYFDSSCLGDFSMVNIVFRCLSS